MSTPLRRLFAGLLFFVIVCVLATLGYIAAGWNPMDAVYMVIITIFGVGYGEVQPVQSPGLRVLTISLIIAGYGTAIYIVGGFVQMVTEGEINRALNKRKMTRGIEQLTGHAIVCGYGRSGKILAKQLAQAGLPFVVVDQDEQKLAEAEEQGYLVIEGDATEEDILESAGVQRARVLATVLPNDAANVFITLTARGMNADMEIIARGEHPSTEKKLMRSGANQVVLPHVIGGQRMAQLITRPSAEQFLRDQAGGESLQHELSHIGLHIDELPIVGGSPLEGQPISEIELKGNHGFLIVGVRKSDGQVVVNPPADCLLAVGDRVILLGRANELPELSKRYQASTEIIYRGQRVRTTG
ncbi:MAG: potassium channel protein [Planctomycetaceae bacterium]|nr:potassium channel protein [Planctomycetaceae bacterium]